MTGALILAVGLTCNAPERSPAIAADTANDPAVIWRAGETYAAYTGHFTSRRKDWETRDGWAAVPDAFVARARALPTTFRVLAVADEGCGDSMNSMPYLARLVSLAGTLDLHFVNSQRGRAIMEAYRTPDRRAWYANDKGRSALAEWVPMLERIARGEIVCASVPASKN